MATVGRYELRDELGRGGVGVVWRAHDPRLGRDVAIKLLVQATPRLRQRIAREGRALARLDHPGIVKVLDSGETPEGAPWVALELVSGGSLQARLDEDGPLPIVEAATIAAAVADALAYAHGLGVVHRDVKPANILVGADGAPRLGDFGLVKELRSQEGLSASIRGQAMGTPGYFSPEQALGEPETLGPAADVYALGATLHALLTGAPPQDTAHDMAEAVAAAHRAVEPPSARRPEVDAELDALVASMLAVTPDDRPTALEVLQRLQAWLTLHRPGVRAAHGPGPVTAVAVTAALLVTCLAFVLAWRARSTVGEAQARLSAAVAAESSALARARAAETARLVAAGEAEARLRDALARATTAEAQARDAAELATKADARARLLEEELETAGRRQPRSPLTAAADRALQALGERCDAAGRAYVLQALRFAALGRPWFELEPWLRKTRELAPTDLPTALVRVRIALGRDALEATRAFLAEARALGGDPAQVDVLSGLSQWYGGKGNAAVRLWDEVALRDRGAWGAVAARLAIAARGGAVSPQPPGVDPWIDSAAAHAHVFQLAVAPGPAAEVQAVVDALGAVDAHLLEVTIRRRFDAGRTSIVREAALSDLADVLRLTGVSSRLCFFQTIFEERKYPHWEPYAVSVLEDALVTEGARADLQFVRGLASLLQGEEAEAVLGRWRQALDRDPYLVLAETHLGEFRRRFGDTPALQELLARRRTR